MTWIPLDPEQSCSCESLPFVRQLCGILATNALLLLWQVRGAVAELLRGAWERRPGLQERLLRAPLLALLGDADGARKY